MKCYDLTMGQRGCASKPPAYRLSPELAVEYFGEKALILVAPTDSFLTVNKAAADLLELAREVFCRENFSSKDLLSLLLKHYNLPAVKVRDAVRDIIASWLKHGVLTTDKERSQNGR